MKSGAPEKSKPNVLFTVATLMIFGSAAGAADREADLRFFETHIRPVLVEHCYECHNSVDTAEGDLSVDWRGGLLQGGSSGASVVPGKPKTSLLLKVLRHEIEGLQMPEGGPKLSDETIAHFESWIRRGAVDPRTEKPTAESLAEATSWEAKFERRKDWWSLKPLRDPIVPDSERVTHPVDRFLERVRSSTLRVESEPPDSESQATGLADRWTVLRRLHYVLTGLPATSQEMSDFNAFWEAEGRDAAVRKTADLLLESPHFGERWAQHWLDWFRYTEGHGGQGDPGIENVTEYRDYMIRALNANVPYDQLIREHLAGDLLETPRLDTSGMRNESIIGLAQYRFVEHGFFPVDALDELIKFTDNQIDVVTKATLGVTVSCARCHDHKFDPISQRDYHALFGIFASSRPARRPVLAPGVIDSRRAKLQDAQDRFAAAIKAHWLESIPAPEIRKRLDAFAAQHTEWEKNPTEPVETLAGSVPVQQPHLVMPGDALEPWIRWQKDAEISQQWEQWPAKLKALRSNAETHNRSITVEVVDFRNGIPDGWTVTDGTIEPVKAGAIGLATDADGAVESILPSGLITHRTTTHEQAALFSPDFTVEGFNAIAANWSGGGWSSFRLVPQNFPRGGGGIYRQSESRDDSATRWFSEETDFWKGNRAYFHFQTRGTSPAPPTSPRGADGKPIPTFPQPHGSWFHVAEVRKLRDEKDKVQATQFSGNTFVSAGTTPVRDRDSLAVRYAESIQDVVSRWQTPNFTDEDAVFLTELLHAGVLDGRRETIGADAQSALASLRKVEGEFVAFARPSTPAVVESAGFDQPLYLRGNHQTPGDPVPRGFLSVFGDETFELKEETGRLQLAMALTRGSTSVARLSESSITTPDSRSSTLRVETDPPDSESQATDGNPLFARVIANRIWHHVFRRGLVTTPDNFGRTGQPPTHPELLEHLAVRMQRTNYDIQDAIRYLITTELFQLSSTPANVARLSESSIHDSKSLATDAHRSDPANRLWTHALLRRLDAEVVRDHMLAVSGQLVSTIHGQSIHPTTPPKHNRRRSLYIARKRTARNDLLDAFDMPVPNTTLGSRDVTTTPGQAITLLNSPFVRFHSRKWAEAHVDAPPEESLNTLIRTAFSRPARETELATLMQFYESNGGGVDGLTETAHLVFNCKEFIYLP